MNGENLEGSSHGLTEVLTWYVPTGMEENHGEQESVSQRSG